MVPQQLLYRVLATHPHVAPTCGESEECLTRDVLLAWGESHNWQRLQVTSWWAIPEGEASWRGYAATHGLSEMQGVLVATARVEGKRTVEAIA